MFAAHIIHYTHKVNADGTSPVIMQVLKKRRTIANVLPSQWNDEKKRVIPKSHPNYATINIQISDEYNRIENLILNNNFDLQRDFIDYFDTLRNRTEAPAITGKTFSEIIPLYISSLKSGFSMISYEARLKSFAKITSVENLALSDITKKHIDIFIAHMAKEGNKRSTMRTKLKIVRYLSSFAAKAGISPKNPAIADIELPTAERAYKGKLNKDELTAFKNYVVVDNPIEQEAQDMFLLAVYLRGMRIGDVIQLRQEYFNDGRLVYESGKNKKQFNIKLLPDALKIVNKYLDDREYLFTFFKHIDNDSLTTEENMKRRARHVQSITTVVNKALKDIAGAAGIATKISTHIGRHTFAKMAIESVKDFNLSMDLIGHSNIKEHQLYIREISEAEDLDNAADDIFK